MLPIGRRTTFTEPPTAFERQLVPVAATMLASLVPIMPLVATEPLVPPFGLVVFVVWRLLRNDIWPLWAGLPLGLFDDFFSGQPVGTAVCGWTAILLAIDAFDRRLPWRDHWQDWAIAVVTVAAHQMFALAIVAIDGGVTSPLLLWPQLVASALIYPLCVRACAALDRWRLARG